MSISILYDTQILDLNIINETFRSLLIIFSTKRKKRSRTLLGSFWFHKLYFNFNIIHGDLFNYIQK